MGCGGRLEDWAGVLVDRAGQPWLVRHLLPADGAALAAYFALLSADDYANFHPHPLDPAAAARLAGSGEEGRCLLLPGQEGAGGVAGYGFLGGWSDPEPELGMSLAPGARGLGLGAAFTRYLLRRAAAAGRAAVRLCVYRDNLPAIRAYRAAGFRELDSHSDHWGGREREEVRMRCPLPPDPADTPSLKGARRDREDAAQAPGCGHGDGPSG